MTAENPLLFLLPRQQPRHDVDRLLKLALPDHLCRRIFPDIQKFRLIQLLPGRFPAVPGFKDVCVIVRNRCAGRDRDQTVPVIRYISGLFQQLSSGRIRTRIPFRPSAQCLLPEIPSSPSGSPGGTAGHRGNFPLHPMRRPPRNPCGCSCKTVHTPFRPEAGRPSSGNRSIRPAQGAPCGPPASPDSPRFQNPPLFPGPRPVPHRCTQSHGPRTSLRQSSIFSPETHTTAVRSRICGQHP